MLSIEVDIDTVDGLGDKTTEGVYKFLEKGADRGFATYLDRMPVDRGNMQQNSYSPTRDGSRVRYGTQDIPYAQAIDKGTEPYWAPIDPLREWAERVTGDPGFGYYVQWKIAKEGIDAQPFSQPAIEDQIRWYRSHGIQRFIDEEFR